MNSIAHQPYPTSAFSFCFSRCLSPTFSWRSAGSCLEDIYVIFSDCSQHIKTEYLHRYLWVKRMYSGDILSGVPILYHIDTKRHFIWNSFGALWRNKLSWHIKSPEDRRCTFIVLDRGFLTFLFVWQIG